MLFNIDPTLNFIGSENTLTLENDSLLLYFSKSDLRKNNPTYYKRLVFYVHVGIGQWVRVFGEIFANSSLEANDLLHFRHTTFS